MANASFAPLFGWNYVSSFYKNVFWWQVAITDTSIRVSPAICMTMFAFRLFEAMQKIRDFAKTDVEQRDWFGNENDPFVNHFDVSTTMCQVIELRVGIHHGEFVGGIVGTKVLRYQNMEITKIDG